MKEFNGLSPETSTKAIGRDEKNSRGSAIPSKRNIYMRPEDFNSTGNTFHSFSKMNRTWFEFFLCARVVVANFSGARCIVRVHVGNTLHSMAAHGFEAQKNKQNAF